MASRDSGSRQHEDPRLSFSTPEFKEAQRIFTDNLKAREPLEGRWALQAVTEGRGAPPLTHRLQCTRHRRTLAGRSSMRW